VLCGPTRSSCRNDRLVSRTSYEVGAISDHRIGLYHDEKMQTYVWRAFVRMHSETLSIG